MAGISEIKQELTGLPAKKLVDLCLQLAKYKKENKELLSYLLFHSHDPQAFVEGVKEGINLSFAELPKTNWYLTKKSLRRILRTINKYSKYTGARELLIEMLLHFCINLKKSGIPSYKNQAFSNLFNQQVNKINVLMRSIHEDLRFDYEKQLQALSD